MGGPLLPLLSKVSPVYPALAMSARIQGAVVLDATDAVDDLFATSNPARLTLVPREGTSSFMLQAEDIEIRVISRS